MAARAARVLAGTSGFSYPAWRGSFYPDELPAREMLRFYARALATVEINHTFHRLPTPELLTGWARQTPAGFRFALKAPQRITHVLRLRDAGEVTAAFCRAAAGLGPKLGPLLFQLPPNFKKATDRLGDLLAQLPPGLRAALEFRHASWFDDETYALLRARNAALCVADTEDGTTPTVATADWGYVRLRAVEYADDALNAWIATLRRVGGGWREAFVFFKHEESGSGPALARRLVDLLERPAEAR